jgi:flap endonuclease-1
VLKSKELDKRKEQKQKAEEEKEKAIEAGDFEKAKQMAGRSIKITDEMMQDAKKLCKMLGCPIIEAPSEAEAQCAELCKMDLAYGVASEDMDSLTFGSTYLLRGFNSKKEPITQIELKAMLEGFEMDMDEFIDLCIMCGCDYTHSIGGIGPIKAFKLMKDEGNIEKILQVIKKGNEDPEKRQKFIIPDAFLFEESRELFKKPDVIRDKAEVEKLMKWEKPDEEELKDFLINKKGFAENKVLSGLKKLTSCQGKKNQSRLDSFFKSAGMSQSSTQTKSKNHKSGGASQKYATAASAAQRKSSASRFKK